VIADQSAVDEQRLRALGAVGIILPRRRLQSWLARSPMLAMEDAHRGGAIAQRKPNR